MKQPAGQHGGRVHSDDYGVSAVRTLRRKVGRGTHITARATALPPGRMSILCLSVCIDIKSVSHS